MFQRTFLLISFLLSFTFSFAQDKYTLEFIIPQSGGQKAEIYSYYGDQRLKIDSTISNGNGVFSFHFNDDREPGIYRFSLGKNDGMDFIFNHENAVIKIDRGFTPDSAEVEYSVENKILFNYLSKKVFYEMRLELLRPVVRYYPVEDSFYPDVKKQYEKLEKDYDKFIDGVYKDHPDLIVTRFIRFDQLEDIRPGEIGPTRAQYLRQHYFDGIDLSDTLLLYSPLLPGRVIDYLSLYVTPGIGQQKQEELFKQAIDSLMHFTLPGSKVREVVVNYLIEGFQAYGLEDVMEYLVENYVINQSCVSEQREETLKKRIDGFKKLAIGNKAPDIVTTDIEGNPFKLSALPDNYKVLFFWASDCPHCEAALPAMKQLAQKYAGKATFIAISVDSDEAAWKKAVAEKGLDWTNIGEMQGWDGKIVNDYYIYATPTILVLDKELTILAKPAGVRDLENFLAGHLPPTP